MIRLYPDQVELVDSLRNALRKDKSVLLQAVTGSGKTIVVSHLFERAMHRKKRSMMLVPRQELLSQTSNTFSKFDIPHSFISAGRKYDPRSNSFVATVGALLNRLDTAPDIDFLAVDETHYGSTSLDKIIKHYKSRGTYIIGLSATPQKLSGKGLGCWYDSMVEGRSVSWLIENKRLSKYIMLAPDTPDMTGIKTTAGDYNHSELADKMENDRVLIGNVVNHYQKHANGKLNVTFGVSRKHSEMLNQSFLDAGIPSAYVDGTTPHDERRRIFRALANHEILNVCNCELLTFGFDLASAAEMDVTIESISVGRPSQSLAMIMQIYGRVLRYKDYPAIIFDHSGNVRRHGFPDDDRNWTLADRKRRSQKQESDEADEKIRQCQKCYAVHRPAPVCPYCGFVYHVKPREIEQVEGDLQQVTRQTRASPKIDREVSGTRTRESLEQIATERGYKNPSVWAEIRLAAREGRKPNYALAMARRKRYG